MPASALPVPSKSALRTLRRLAIGTSCTVAVSAAILTEDRRCRIRAARQVHNNAKKLKSSRNYHSAGAAFTETLDEQVLSRGDGAVWTLRKPSETTNSGNEEHPKTSVLAKSKLEKGHTRDGTRLVKWPQQLSWSRRSNPRIQRYTLHDPTSPMAQWQPPPVERQPALSTITASDLRPAKRRPLHGQSKLALSIWDILTSGDEGDASTNIDTAASRFLETFEEGVFVEKSGLTKSLIGAAVELCKRCRIHGKFGTFEKILDTVLGCGPIDQGDFFLFRPHSLIREVLRGRTDPTTGQIIIDKERLEKACSLFLTTFKDKPNVQSIQAPGMKKWTSLGIRLCDLTYNHGLYKSTEDVYWNLQNYGTKFSTPVVQYLIRAAYYRHEYHKVIDYFRRFYVETLPRQTEFYTTSRLVINAIVDSPLPNYDVAEEVLFLLIDMAAGRRLTASTTSILKVLGSQWRAHRDISKIKILFERLQPSFKNVGHPTAVYGALIQFCIEAGDEPAAIAYYEQMRKSLPPDPGDVRIHGHFAFSKALRGDWQGVKNDFRHMLDSSLALDKYSILGENSILGEDSILGEYSILDEYSAAFTPILDLFQKSHTVRETEDFIWEMVEKLGIKVLPNMSNMMVDKYLEAGEIDSVARWLEYMHSVGSPIPFDFFNSVLMSCHRKWNFHFEAVYQFYQRVQRQGDWTKHLFNDKTRSIMRSLALSSLDKNGGRVTKRLKPWIEPWIAEMSETSDPLSSTAIRDAMAMAVARDEHHSALKLYKKALADQVPLDASTVSLAVKASLRNNPDHIDVSLALLEDAMKKGQDISDAISCMFIHQISAIYGNAEEGCRHVQEVARDTFFRLEDRGIRVPVRDITHVIYLLGARGQNREAISFWESMIRREGQVETPLNLQSATVLLEAYIRLQDCEGIKWVMHMVTVHDIVLDVHFKSQLQNAQRRAEMQRGGKEYRGVIADALNIVKSLRLEAQEEKDNIQVKTIQIMERAIDLQKARECENAMGYGGSLWKPLAVEEVF